MNNCNCVYNIRREQLHELRERDPVAYQILDISETARLALSNGRVDEKYRDNAAEILSAEYDVSLETAYHWIDKALAETHKPYRQPWWKRWFSGG